LFKSQKPDEAIGVKSLLADGFRVAGELTPVFEVAMEERI
jgi:hypothetical protein